MPYWVEGEDGRRYGPVDEATLRLWAGQGRVVPQTPLIEETSGVRRRADEVLDTGGPAGSPAPGGAAPPGGFPCPNCRRWLVAPAPLCPNCGFVFRRSEPAVPERLLTGRPMGDTLLGALAVVLTLAGPLFLDSVVYAGQGSGSWAFLLLPFSLFLFAAYVILRRRFPALARGMGGGLLLGCGTVPVVLVVGLAALIHHWATTPFRVCNW